MRDTSPDIEAMADEVVRCADGSRGTIYAALRDAYQMGRYGLRYSALKQRQEREAEAWRLAHKDEIVI